MSPAGCVGVTVETGAGSRRVTRKNVLQQPPPRRDLPHHDDPPVYHSHLTLGNTGHSSTQKPSVYNHAPERHLATHIQNIVFHMPNDLSHSLIHRIVEIKVIGDNTVSIQSDASQVRKKE